ncbi:PQQ-binding-like beta-propeller repeat protein [Luteolibacter marinus]|uniref:outer membrane protein assembly factor BamB family protein n=1 Tax=Luteolibacter marinus TaxID=2776705 RepID=UPI001866D0B9
MKAIPLLCLILTQALPANDWPRFRGPHGDNSLPEADIIRSFPESGPEVLWSRDLSEGYGGAAIAGDEVFLMDRVDQEKDVLMCLGLADGKLKWQWEHAYPGRISHPGSRTVPTVTAETVYTSSGFGHVYCIDRKTRKERWVVDVIKTFGVQPPRFGYSIHPVIIGDRCIIAPTGDDVGIAALDTKSGEVVWKSKPVGESHSSPVSARILGRDLLVMPGSRNGELMLTGFDPKDGSQVFQYTQRLSGGRHNSIPNITMVGEDKAFLTGGYGQGTQFLKFSAKEDAITVEKLNEVAPGATIHPVLKIGDQAYLSSGGAGGGGRRNRRNDSANATPGGLVCMDLDGKILWSSNRQPDLGEGSIISAGGIIISQDGATGHLRLIEPGPVYKELASAKVFSKPPGRELWAPLALSRGRLVMRSQNEIACIDLSKD